MLNGLYNELFALLQDVIVGSSTMTPYLEYSINLMCTVACTLLVFLPFYVVYRVVRMICG